MSICLSCFKLYVYALTGHWFGLADLTDTLRSPFLMFEAGLTF